MKSSIFKSFKIFLLGNSFSPYKGDDIALALLFDMNLLFESYIYSFIKRNWDYKSIKNQDKTHYLAFENSQGKFRLKPDIVINSGESIIDTKWKNLNEEKSNNGVSQADMYQLYAYGTKYTNCKKLYLIYPYNRLDLMLKYSYFKDGNLDLEVLFFDLENGRFTSGKTILPTSRSHQI